VFTEVPGNDGQSLTNAIDRLVEEMISTSGAAPVDTRIFQIIPSGFLGNQVAIVDEVLGLSARPAWRRTTRAAVEVLLGMPLPALPAHDELIRLVLALTGRDMVEVVDPVVEIVPVADLPSPHNPWKCSNSPRFRELSVAQGQLAHGISAGELFRSGLTAAEVRSCPIHQVDWNAIGLEAVRIAAAGGSAEVMLATAKRSLALNGGAKRLLVSLFESPIMLRDSSYIDGQHRACGLWFSGLPDAVVSVSDRVSIASIDVWTYRSDG